jgi:hypothetical protein
VDVVSADFSPQSPVSFISVTPDNSLIGTPVCLMPELCVDSSPRSIADFSPKVRIVEPLKIKIPFSLDQIPHVSYKAQSDEKEFVRCLRETVGSGQMTLKKLEMLGYIVSASTVEKKLYVIKCLLSYMNSNPFVKQALMTRELRSYFRDLDRVYPGILEYIYKS